MRVLSAHRTRPKRGEARNGDAVIVRSAGDAALFAVVDALGHGDDAADAAAISVAFLHEVALGTEIRVLMSGLHRALRGSRGAAATVCLLDGAVLTGCGVGNVEMRSRGTAIPFSLSPGILGSNCAALRSFRQVIATGDRIALFSDGVQRTLSLEDTMPAAVSDAAPALFSRYASEDDDATLLVVEVMT